MLEYLTIEQANLIRQPKEDKDMQSEERKKIAGRIYFVLLAIWIVLLVGIFGQAFVSARDPSPIWQLPIGGLLIIFGVHLLYFRQEMAEILAEYVERHSWSAYVIPVRYSSKYFVPAGCIFVIIGIVLIGKTIPML
jgi:hypothetical protein